MAKLIVEALAKSFGELAVINHVSLQVGTGEIVALVGISGVGKSTCFQIISGLDVPDSGRVILDGADVTGRSGKIGYMLQKDLLFAHRTVLGNLSLPLILKGASKQEAEMLARKGLEDIGLQHCAKQYPATLSGGMRQRVAYLRTQLCGNDMLLLDEPFSALDAITKMQIYDWFLNTVHQNQVSVLLVTHDIAEAVRLASRIYVIAGMPGTIVHEVAVNRMVLDTAADFDAAASPYKREILQHLV